MYKYNYSAINHILKNTKDPILIRSFTLEENTEGSISVLQKDRKIFEGTCVKYQYSWMRLILVMRESSSFRWVGGAYSNEKQCFIKGSFEAG